MNPFISTFETNLAETNALIAKRPTGFCIANLDRTLALITIGAVFRFGAPISPNVQVCATVAQAERVAARWNKNLPEAASGSKVRVVGQRKMLTDYARIQTALIKRLSA